ncbi:YicC family protein [Puniceicoccaceae bacterium K14]|nr:YicC family protein [Puniceicoccaceae bacterium K14]
MNSMTGFGRTEVTRDGVVVALQVSSVNRKNLEVVCNLPRDLQRLERSVSEQVRKLAGRGRFQFSFEIKGETASSSLPGDEQIDSAIARLKEVAQRNDSVFELNGEVLVSLVRLLDADGADIPEEIVESLIREGVDLVLKELLAMRAQEGVALFEDLSARRLKLKALVSEIRELAPEMVENYRKNLFTRLQQADLDFDLDDERVLKEIALFADRCDISEELTRLESHFEQFEQLLSKKEPVGRPLEFLMQEIGREVNTTGSKACIIEISRKVMEMKNELERIREQIANVE